MAVIGMEQGKQYDVCIVGAATSGSFLARRLAEAGVSVLMIDALTKETLGTRLDIFHVGAADFDRFSLPKPEADDDFAFSFSRNRQFSAFDHAPKETQCAVVGMHMPRYIARMNRWAREAGATILLGASFADFVFDENGRIGGITYLYGGETHTARAKLVADCSGVASVCRRKLPDGYGVENFTIGDAEKFYVTLRYVAYHEPRDYINGSRGWPYYKTWEAPDADPTGAILGVGANWSYEQGEKTFAAFRQSVKLPRHTVTRIERGTTPYRRPPYSFVADGFLVSGDAACLTKPSAGEGVTSAMVQLELAANTISRLLGEGGYLTRARLWPINKGYVERQGKAFASQLATLIGAVATSAKENDFFFTHDVVFSQKTFESLGSGKPLSFTARDFARMGAHMLLGVLTGKLRVKTIRSLFRSMKNGDRVAALYGAYPAEEGGFDEWVKRADALWSECGSMAENGAS